MKAADLLKVTHPNLKSRTGTQTLEGMLPAPDTAQCIGGQAAVFSLRRAMLWVVHPGDFQQEGWAAFTGSSSLEQGREGDR